MTTELINLNIDELSSICNARIERIFKQYIAATPSLELRASMEYTLLNGGKRLRPLFIYATGSLFKANAENLDIPAAAVELVHTYSLIHDDLPCMDNADYRRGKLSCHKEYGEAIAVLTGDALHTLAMQILAAHPSSLTIQKRIQMIATLSKACGPFGMASGQAQDMTLLQDENISSDLLLDIYAAKTGALFTASIQLGHLASLDDDDMNHAALTRFGEKIGLAFQIQDDILDIEGSMEQSGKQPGIDVVNKKMTYPKLHGMVAAKQKVHSLYEAALEDINYLGDQAQLLRELISEIF